ncbi:MAG: oligosaccharide flippase family protein [Bacteroidota bacterium]|nr:oligosaccharide flippase family protein [Bacteroidota bacterium]
MISKILKSEFFKNVATMMTGTAIAQAIPFLISPILSRLYTPEEFAVLAIFMSIATVIGVISTGRYELAIMLPEKKRDAQNLLLLSLAFSLIVSLITLLFIILFRQPILIFFESPELGPWLYLIPVMVLTMGIYQAFNYWSTRNKTFRMNAASRISQSVVASSGQLALGVARTGSAGLIAGVIAGQITAAFVLAWKTLRKPRELKRSASLNCVKENAYRYSNFLKINTPHAFVDSLKNEGMVYLIIYFFTKTVLGSYAFAYRILKAPIGLIGSSFYQVFFEKASRAVDEGTPIQPMVLKIYRNLFLFGFPGFALVFLYTPEIFSFVFGNKWLMAGEIAQILIPWLFLNFLATPVSCLTVIMNKQKEAMLVTIIDITLKVIAVIIGGITGDYRLSFILLSISSSLVMIFALFWYYHIAGIRNTKRY